MKKLSRKQMREIKKQALDNEVSISKVLIKKEKYNKDLNKKEKLVFNEDFDRKSIEKSNDMHWNFNIGELLYYNKKDVCLVIEKILNKNSYTREKYTFSILLNNKRKTVSGYNLSFIN